LSDEIATELVGKIAVIGGIGDEDVGPFAGFEGATGIGEGDCASAMESGGEQGFGRKKLLITAGESHDELHGWARGGAGIEVSGESDGCAGIDHGAGVGIVSIAKMKIDGGDGDAHGGTLRELGDLFGSGGVEVIDTDRAEGGSHERAAEIDEFIDVSFDKHAVFNAGFENTPRLREREGVLLAEDIDKEWDFVGRE